MFKPGDKIIWTDGVANRKPSIFEGTVRSASRDEVRLEGEEFPRFAAFMYPDTPECRDFLAAGIAHGEMVKQLEADRMKAVYEGPGHGQRDEPATGGVAWTI